MAASGASEGARGQSFFARLWAGQWRLVLGVAVSAAFLYLALRQVTSYSEVLSYIRGANYAYLLPGLAAYLVAVWLRGVRWHVLLRPLRRIPAGRLFPVVVIGFMANDLLPARLGELVRAYVLGEREKLSKTALLATIAVERTFDGLALLTLMAAVGLFVPFDARLQGVFQGAAAIFALAVLGFFVLATSRPRALRLLELALRPAPSRLRERATELAGRFLAGLEAMQSGWLVAATFGLSLGVWVSEAGLFYLLGLGFGQALPPAAYLLTTAVANLGGMLPSAPGYLGTFEYFSQLSLSLFGVRESEALGYVLVVHAALVVPIVVLGLFYLYRYGFSLGSLRSTRRLTADGTANGAASQTADEAREPLSPRSPASRTALIEPPGGSAAGATATGGSAGPAARLERGS